MRVSGTNLGYFVGGTFFSLGIRSILKAPLKVAEDAVSGWINQQISNWFGIQTPSVYDVINFIIEWGPSFLLGFLLFYFMAKTFEYRAHYAGISTIAPAVNKEKETENKALWKFSEDKRHTHFVGDGTEVTFYRIKVENISDHTMTGVAGYVVDVEKNRVPQRFNETVQLTFAPGEAEDALSKTIPTGIAHYLDVAFLASDGRFGLGTKGRRQLVSVAKIFDSPAEYKLVVKITANNVPPVTINAILHLTGDRATTEIECPEVNV